jgi:hypothetical protein
VTQDVISQKKQNKKIINSTFNALTMSSKEIDDKIVELFSNGKDIYIVNDNLLKEIKI